MEKIYYLIDEDLAKRSKGMWSFYDYVNGSETEAYKKCVDRAYELADEVTNEYRERAFYYADMYAKKYAENINKRFRIDMRCPSAMISGAANFPVRKKEKQMNALNNAFTELKYIDKYLDKIEDLKYMVPKVAKQGIDNGKSYDNEYFKVEQNEELNRLQLFFDGKPSEEIRSILKSNGYKWSGKNVCWQRQLTPNARRNVSYILNKIKSLAEV